MFWNKKKKSFVKPAQVSDVSVRMYCPPYDSMVTMPPALSDDAILHNLAGKIVHAPQYKREALARWIDTVSYHSFNPAGPEGAHAIEGIEHELKQAYYRVDETK